MLYTIIWPLLYAITHPLGGPIHVIQLYNLMVFQDKTVVWSANTLILLFLRQFGKTFIYIINTNGPKLIPVVHHKPDLLYLI